MSGTNPVAAYTLLNNATVSDVTTYKAEIDANSVVAARIVGNFAPHQTSPPAMTVTLDAGHYYSGTTLTEVATQTTGTITAPVTHPRIDRVVVNASGTISVITGVENASPVAPAITPGHYPVAQALLQTTSTTITNSMITDERDSTGLSAPSPTPAYSSIAGCLITSLAGNHTTATATITSGQATDSANAAYITSAGYSWAASNGNAINGTDAGSSTLANSTTYHMFLCSGGSGTGTFCSASLTPTFPTGYTTSTRRIGSFNTTGAGAPLPYTSVEIAGGATINWLSTVVQDIANTGLISANRVAQVLTSIPSGLKFKPEIIATTDSSGNAIWLSSPDAPDTAPAAEATPTTSPGLFIAANVNVNFIYIMPNITTDTSKQIYARGQTGTSGHLYITTLGWTDFRRG